MIAVFVFVRIIYPEQCPGERGDLTEADEERFMDLSLRVDKDAEVEHDHSSNGEDRSRKELYVQIMFHGAKVLLFLPSWW